MGSQGTFGQRLRQLRVQCGLSQTELARPGLSPSYISLLEAGKRLPTDSVVERLAAALNCSVQFLLHGVDPEEAQELEVRLRYAELALQSGEAAEAASRFRMLLERDSETPERVLVDARWGLARALEATGDIEPAIAAYEALRDDAEARPRELPWLQCVIALCRCYRETGDLAHSIALAELARARVSDLGLGGTDLEVQLGSTLVGSYHERGDMVRARILADQVIEAAERLDSPLARGAAYWNASLVADEMGRPAEGLRLAERALALYAHGEDARNLSRLRTAYAGLLLRQEPPRLAEARPLLEVAARQLADAGSGVDLAYVETELARVELLLNSPDTAVTVAERALHRLGPEPRLEAARAMLVLGHAQFARGDEDAALLAYSRATRDLAAMGGFSAGRCRVAGAGGGVQLAGPGRRGPRLLPTRCGCGQRGGSCRRSDQCASAFWRWSRPQLDQPSSHSRLSSGLALDKLGLSAITLASALRRTSGRRTQRGVRIAA